MILLIDADSLIWSSCYKTKRQPDEPLFFEDIREAEDKFDEVLMKVVNDIEENYCPADKIEIYADSRGNFRKLLYKKYKANRKKREIPPILGGIQKYVREQYEAISMVGVETDDVVASAWKKYSEEYGRDNVMIVSIDKDYKQFPCKLYNYHYNHRCVYDITEEEAMYNFYEQMIIGDTADNVNFCVGYGKRYAEKLFEGAKTKYDYSKRTYSVFQEIYKSKARKMYELCYNLLKLREDLY